MDKYIIEAIKEAKKSLKTGDVPVGAIIVEKEKIISKAHNKKEKTGIATKHAEIIAIEKACKKKKNWRLDGSTIYVTMHPCQMCLGAIIQSRISQIVYILSNEKYANIENKKIEQININKTQITEEKYTEEIKQILTNFFEEKRK